MANVVLRKKSVYVAIIILIASLGINFWFSSMKTPPAKAAAKSGVTLVQTKAVQNQLVPASIWISGRLRASQKVELFTEVTGKLKAGQRAFKDGTAFNRGQVLLQLDDSDYRMNLNASRSAFQSVVAGALADIKLDFPKVFDLWLSFTNSISATKALPELPEINNDQLKRFLSAQKVLNQYYSIKAQEAQLAKYQIVAPFSGVLANANLNPGTVIRANQAIGEFINPNKYELETGVSLDDAQKIEVGQSVLLSSNDIDGEWTGKIIRIGKSVDANTQTVKIYVELNGKDLYEGMYLSGNVSGDNLAEAITIPRHLLIDEQFVYIVHKDKLQKKQVKVLHENRDEVVVTGLPNATVMVNQIIPGASEGMPVAVINQKASL